jgi:hypothetical protein
MAPLHWLLLLAFCLLALPREGLAGNCSQVPARRLSRPGAIYEITGASAVVYPAFNDQPVPGILANWTVFSLVERNRTIYDINGGLLGSSLCYDPGDAELLLQELVDPFAPGVPNEPCFSGTNRPCGGLYQHLDLHDMDCYQTHVIAPFEGTMRESIFAYLTHPLYPNFSMVASFHLVDQPVTVYPLQNDSSVVYHYEYEPALACRRSCMIQWFFSHSWTITGRTLPWKYDSRVHLEQIPSPKSRRDSKLWVP